MGNRVAAVLVFLGIAVAAAAWYASSAGGSAQPTIPPELVVNATEVGSGNWVRYLVSVRNVGDVPFEGDVVLTGSSSPAASAPASGVPPPRLPTSVPRFPTQAPDAAYETHVSVAARETRTLTITAPDRYSQVEVAQSSDGSLAAAVGVDRSPSAAVAVLTDSQAAASDLQGLPLDDFTVRAAAFTARSFPSTSLGLAPYAAVVIDQFDVQALSSAQRDALRDFVGRGGGLVVAGGPSWRRTLPALPPEIAPLHATGSATADLAPLLSLTHTAGSVAVTTATGDLRAGAWAVVGAGGIALLVDGTYGSGTVAVLAFDPGAEVVGTDAARAAWTAGLGEAMPHRGGGAPAATTVPGVSFQDAVSFPPLRAASLPSPWLVGPLLLLYLVVVAPLNYLLLRRRLRSPDLLWVTAPLIAVLFTGTFYWLGTDLQGGLHDEEIQVLQLGPNGSVASVDYHRVVFTRRGTHQLVPTQPALAAPLTFDLSSSTGQETGGCGASCTLALSGLPSGEEHVVPAVHPLVLERGVVYGGVRILGTASVTRQPIAIAAHLESAGGRIVGEVDNNGERPVHGLVLYSVEQGSYRRTPLASVVLAGARVEVNAQGATFDGDPDAAVRGLPPDAGTRISRAVGAELLGGGTGRAWLVGFTDPVATRLAVDGSVPPTAATAVFDTPVSLERADGQVSDWGTTRLVASAGQRGRGFTDVYDLQLPARLPAALRVEYQKAQFGAVEVFDWGSGQWSSGGYGDDPADPTRTGRALTPTELLAAAGGAFELVRLRVAEPRIGWGAGLFVTSS